MTATTAPASFDAQFKACIRTYQPITLAELACVRRIAESLTTGDTATAWRHRSSLLEARKGGPQLPDAPARRRTGTGHPELDRHLVDAAALWKPTTAAEQRCVRNIAACLFAGDKATAQRHVEALKVARSGGASLPEPRSLPASGTGRPQRRAQRPAAASAHPRSRSALQGRVSFLSQVEASAPGTIHDDGRGRMFMKLSVPGVATPSTASLAAMTGDGTAHRLKVMPWGRVDLRDAAIRESLDEPGALLVNARSAQDVPRHFAERDVGMFVNADHGATGEAMGWVESVEVVPGEGLFVAVNWTDVGESAVRGRRYRYTSPEVILDASRWLADGSPAVVVALTGLAILNRPAILNQAAIADEPS